MPGRLWCVPVHHQQWLPRAAATPESTLPSICHQTPPVTQSTLGVTVKNFFATGRITLCTTTEKLVLVHVTQHTELYPDLMQPAARRVLGVTADDASSTG